MWNAFLDSLGEATSASFIDNPIFVVGASRSGTSVLLQALGRHPDIISCPGEAPFLTSIGGAVAQFELADNKAYYNASLSCSKPYLYNALRKLALDTSCGEYYGLKHYTKHCLSRRRLARPGHWSAKTFPTRRGADALCTLFPGARFIHIVRNGLNVVQSMTKFSGFKNHSFTDNCRAWDTSVKTFGYLGAYPAGITVKHERLTDEPDNFFDRIFDFTGLRKDPSAAAFVRNTVVHPLDKETKQHADARQEFENRPAPYSAWSATQRADFLEICSASMQKLGYEIPTALTEDL